MAALSPGGVLGIPGGSSQVPTSYQGELAPGLSSLQSSSLQQMQGQVPGAGTAAGQGLGSYGTSQKTLQNIMQSSPMDLTGYYKTNILDPLKSTFEQTTLPDIVSAMGGSLGGPQSTGAATAVQGASKDFNTQLDALQGQLGYSTAMQNIQNQLGASQLAGQQAPTGLNMLSSLLQSGGVPYGVQAAADQAGQQNWEQNLKDLMAFMSDPQQAIISGNNLAVAGQPGALAGFAGSTGGSNFLANALNSAIGQGAGSQVSGGGFSYDPALANYFQSTFGV